MDLDLDAAYGELEKERVQFSQQQKEAERVFHQCEGAIAYIDAKIQDIRNQHKKQKETNEGATMDAIIE